MRSQDAVVRVYDEAGNVIETHEQAGDFGVGSDWEPTTAPQSEPGLPLRILDS
jgi:hypothetical protein